MSPSTQQSGSHAGSSSGAAAAAQQQERSGGAACGVSTSSSGSGAGPSSSPPPPPSSAGSAPSAAAAATAASASAASADDRKEYLEQKYGAGASAVALTAQQVEGMLERALTESATVRYLLESLKLGGCGVGRNFFHVTACDAQVNGGFSTDYGVILCHNRLSHQREVELAVAHELVHAYDHCRAANLDLTDCRHHACTEIRAANLSGDCSFAQELLRGRAMSEPLVGQHKRCVRRRALMSVAMNPHCGGAKAEAAVAEMMPKCFRDTDPWPRVPGL